MKKLSDIFDIWYWVNLEVVNCIETDKSWIPFVSRTSENNGVSTYVEQNDYLEPNPAFTISIAWSGSVLSTFFHDYEYYSWRDLYIAKPRIALSKQEMLYYCTIIEANKYRYSYGRQANKTLKDILVPSPEDIPASVKDYNLDDKFIEKPLSPKKLTLDTRNWKIFLAKEVFKITLGRPIHKSDLETELSITGNPYITRTTERNWTEWYIDEEMEEYMNIWNAITIWAEWFMAFYQEEDFYNGNKVSILRNSQLNKYNAIFLVSILDKEVGNRFSYWRGAVKWKLEKMKIKLPITADEVPDWQWMEEYIKGLPYSASL